MPFWFFGLIIPIVVVFLVLVIVIPMKIVKRKRQRQAREQAQQREQAYQQAPIVSTIAKIVDKQSQTKHTGETQFHYSRAYEVYTFTLQFENGNRDSLEVVQKHYNSFIVGDTIVIQKKTGRLFDIVLHNG